MSGFINLTGKKFGRWTVQERTPKDSHNQEVRWLCLCECGNTKIVGSTALRRGESVSCGCYQSDYMRERQTTHGESGDTTTGEYKAWRNMKARCTIPGTKYYDNYGGRGIKICERWEQSYTSFLEDMGRKPANNYTLDRIENNGNYEKDNCKWSSRKEQTGNRRNTKYIEYHGETRRLSDVANELGVYIQLVDGWRKGKLDIDYAYNRYMNNKKAQ